MIFGKSKRHTRQPSKKCMWNWIRKRLGGLVAWKLIKSQLEKKKLKRGKIKAGSRSEVEKLLEKEWKEY